MQLVFKKPYKSIKALLNIELNDFTVLTGVNGSGKSHLLEAIKNGSIRMEGITLNNSTNNNYLNQIRLFDWYNLVPNDTEAINSYDLNQGRDNDWQRFHYQTAMYKNQLKQWLRQHGIHDTSNTQIYELASMEKSELAQELDNTQKADEIYIKIHTVFVLLDGDRTEIKAFSSPHVGAFNIFIKRIINGLIVLGKAFNNLFSQSLIDFSMSWNWFSFPVIWVMVNIMFSTMTN